MSQPATTTNGQVVRPYPKSKTRRVEYANMARRALDRYRRVAQVTSTRDDILRDLLEAEAAIQVALALETEGRLGNLYASTQTILNDHRTLRETR